ncbi:MAG: transcription termination/antitermination protein NusG [Bryobacteraceae bacterium]
MNGNHLAWFALQVRSPFEQWLSVTLNEKGYEAYLPTYRSRRIWSDLVKEIELPLFQRYLFCRFDPFDRLPILKTPHVQGIVSICRNPASIPDDEIESIRKLAASDRFASPWPYLQEGQRVRVKHGPLAGLEGILTEFKSRYRLVVSVEILQRSIATEIDGECVETVHSSFAQPEGPTGGGRPLLQAVQAKRR